MATATVTINVRNTAKGLRGINLPNGRVGYVEPGTESGPVDVTEAEAASIAAKSYFEVVGGTAPAKAGEPVDDLDTDVGSLKTIAANEGVDLAALEGKGSGANGNVVKADIQKAIRDKREGKTPTPTPPAGGATDLDAMDDETLRTTVQAITGQEPPADADREALLKLARGED